MGEGVPGLVILPSLTIWTRVGVDPVPPRPASLFVGQAERSFVGMPATFSYTPTTWCLLPLTKASSSSRSRCPPTTIV